MRTDVHTWFDRRTYAGSRWSAEELRDRKAVTGSRISVVLPALNEEATAGAIVATIRRELVDRVALVDELIVMDSASTDATAAVAAAAGARVVHIDDVLPGPASVPGKGEVLWKALYATTGDIVVYVDADSSSSPPASSADSSDRSSRTPPSTTSRPPTIAPSPPPTE